MSRICPNSKKLCTSLRCEGGCYWEPSADQPAPTPILEIGPVFNVAVSHSGCNYLAQEDSVCNKCGRYIKPYRLLERELSAARAEVERLRAALEPFLKALENSGAATRKEERNA